MAARRSFASGVCAKIPAASRGEGRTIYRAPFQRLVTVSEVLGDFVTCAGGVFAVAFLYPSLHVSRQNQYSASIVAGLMMVLLLERDGAYRGSSSLLQFRMTEHALRISAQVLLPLLLCRLLLPLNIPYTAFLIAFILLPLLLISEKQVLFATMRILYAGEYGVDRVVVYGTGDAARRTVSTLLDSPRLGLRPVAVIDDGLTGSGECLFEMGYGRCLPVAMRSAPLTPALLKSCRCRQLVVAASNLSPEKLTAAADAAKQAGVEIALLLDSVLEERPGREIDRHRWPAAWLQG